LVTTNFSNLKVGYNAPTGEIYPFSIQSTGKITQFWWGFNSTGWRDLHIRYTLPNSVYFEQVAGAPWVDVIPVIGQPSVGTWQLKLLENTPGPTNTLSSYIQFTVQRDSRQDLPVTGPAVPELAGLDNLMLAFLRTNGFEAATLAVARNGKLVYERGFGWQEENRTTAIQPNVLMRLATGTVPITRRAAYKLIEDGLITGAEKVYDLLAISPPVGLNITDSRVRNITVQQLLNDQSGWPDQAPSSHDIGVALNLGRNATLNEAIAYMWTQNLLFTPGSSTQFSHWGYQVLGAVIERVSGLTYDDYVHQKVGLVDGMPTFQQAGSATTDALYNEIWYAGETFNYLEKDFTQSLPMVAAPYAIDMAVRPAAGSLMCSARDFARFLSKYFHTGTRKPASLVGWNWEYAMYGSLPGSLTVTFDKVYPNGSYFNFVVLVNERIDSNVGLNDTIKSAIQNYLVGITTWPQTDFFSTLPDAAFNSTIAAKKNAATNIQLNVTASGTGNYRILKSTNLNAWQTVAKFSFFTAGVTNFQQSVLNDQKAFFRLSK
jgi:CubicO group peptidase (beta-lactamase class C family)